MYNSNKIVIFDSGGVVESHAFDENNGDRALINTIRRLTKEIMSSREIISGYSRICANETRIFETDDEIEITEWYKKIADKYGIKANMKEFMSVYKEEFDKVDFYKNVVDYSHEVAKQCKVGVLSNLIWLDYDRIDRQLDLSKFDYVWLSYKIGYKKPDRRAYEVVEKECGIHGENILFIDDVVGNINGARKLGWNTCMATGSDILRIKSAVKEFIEG